LHKARESRVEVRVVGGSNHENLLPNFAPSGLHLFRLGFSTRIGWIYEYGDQGGLRRTAALGGHVARCENENCAHTIIAYNSCRNRHCPKCQGAAAREWLAEREAELLPVPYFHVVYTLPAAIRDIAYQNKAVAAGPTR
jgi:hypothetical protein